MPARVPSSFARRRAVGWLIVAVSTVALRAAAPEPRPRIFAGGVAGVAVLAQAEASARFRAQGGGLYLHNNGWAALTPDEREAVVRHFVGAPVAVELGFGVGDHARAWGKLWRENYAPHGFRPAFIAANAFAQNNQPTAAQWRDYSASLRAAGVPEATLILPTFEYQNFRPNIPTLAEHTVTRSPVFQEILRAAGGIVLDTPSGYFFGREEAYREWVVDAIRWTRAQRLTAVVIASPHHSREKFAADTDRFLVYLREHHAAPDIVVVENYEPKPAPDYPNVVGPETQPHSALGVALGLLPPRGTANIGARGEELLFLENGVVKAGIDRAKGGAITWLSSVSYPRNLVNSADPGRLIQQSYYAGLRLDRRAEGQSKAWSPWAWNPIQGGGVGSWARVTEFKRLADGTLFAETIPNLWDMPNEPAAAVMRQWTAFEPGMPDTLVVRCEFVAQRAPGDRWGPARLSPQEIPACYFTRNFSVMQSYLGDGAWRDERQPPGPPWGRTTPPRQAMAFFTADGQGVAVFSPAATQPWNFGPHAGGASDDPAAGPCMHVAPIDRVLLGPASTYRYRYWLILGPRAQLAARLDALWKTYSAERAHLTNPE